MEPYEILEIWEALQEYNLSRGELRRVWIEGNLTLMKKKRFYSVNALLKKFAASMKVCCPTIQTIQMIKLMLSHF